MQHPVQITVFNETGHLYERDVYHLFETEDDKGLPQDVVREWFNATYPHLATRRTRTVRISAERFERETRGATAKAA